MPALLGLNSSCSGEVAPCGGDELVRGLSAAASRG